MRFCSHCVMPDTRPGLNLNEDGVCDACVSYEYRKKIDWAKRRKELEQILNRFRSQDGKNYDCIVPVSGGKDSTYQVVKMLQMGMHPLCITFMASDLSEIGRQNIHNLQSLGVDYITFTGNPRIKNKIARIALERVGDICWLEEVGLNSFIYRVAVQYNIPLIIWGENPDTEYGGPAADGALIDRAWLARWESLLGLSIWDMVGQEGIREIDVLPYQLPSYEEFCRVGVTGLYLGYYLAWDGVMNNIIARGYGMRSYDRVIEGNVEDAGSTDDYRSGIHHYFKYLKYGYGRASDIVSQHIRAGRLTREDGVELVRIHDGSFPWTYLGKPLEEILEPLDLTVDAFIAICDRYTNRVYFKTDGNGNLIKNSHGSLLKKDEYLLR